MKRLFLAFMLFIGFIFRLSADEGMWVISLIQRNYQRMKALGFELTPEDIYSINHSSLKDVVVALDGGSCTAEIVSPNGLLFTNHHCGYEDIQAHSTVEHDYLKDGFWAHSYEEELPNPGKEVWFLVRIEDVTNKVLSKVPKNISELKRRDTIEAIEKQIEDEASENGKYTTQVKDFFDGNQYFLFVYLVYKDIRLVGAPPSSIGKFGGDTDNWMWPRQTGDFSIFRIYAKPDGTPAEYSPDNVPLKTDKYLKISLKGVKEHDFTMIMGFPGTTHRYYTSYEVKELRDHENDIRIKVRKKKLAILKQFMDSDRNLAIKYAAKYAQSSNYYKYSIGQNLAIRRLKIIKKKANTEKELRKWIAADPKRAKKYGKIFSDISRAIKYHSKQDIALNYWFEAVYLGPEFTRLALNVLYAVKDFQNGNTNAFDRLKRTAKQYFRDYDINVDEALFTNLISMYMNNVDSKYRLPFFDVSNEAMLLYGIDPKTHIKLKTHSAFVDSAKFFKYLNDLELDSLLHDNGMSLATRFLKLYFKIKNDKQEIDTLLSKGRRLYMQAYMKMLKEKYPDTLFYPDANSTMRLTYGKVIGYNWEGKHYDYYTTIDQYVEKGRKYADNPDFEMDPKMVELYEKKDYGPYAADDGTLHLCFLTDNDITGGNSGSPVLNGKGELIGLAFDGNWEAMSGDILFDKQVQRTICVDIRYVLFVIDKIAHDTHILNELTIVK